MSRCITGKSMAATAVLLVCICQVDAQEKKSPGAWLRGKVDEENRAVQNRLNNDDKLRNRVSKGIDGFVDNVIDFADPNANKTEAGRKARQATKDTMQSILNPSEQERKRRMNSLVDGLKGSQGYGGGSGTHSSETSTTYQNTSRSYSPSNTTSRYSQSTNSSRHPDWADRMWGQFKEDLHNQPLHVFLRVSSILLIGGAFWFIVNIAIRRRSAFAWLVGVLNALAFFGGLIILFGYFKGTFESWANGIGSVKEAFANDKFNGQMFWNWSAFYVSPSLYALNLFVYFCILGKKPERLMVQQARQESSPRPARPIESEDSQRRVDRIAEDFNEMSDEERRQLMERLSEK
ncbi:MAG: DUF308 domain-containing protein [Phycisphaerae bacterium]|nr:DUF308 domain-containing protein [Phycisphaerae bacterium]